MGTADGSTIGNPPTGEFFVFLDSNNSDSYTLRDDAGTDTILGGGGPTLSYFKDTVSISGGSISASASDQAVPTLTYTITQDGNYIVFAMVSVDIAGSDAKPFSIMLFKNGVKETNSLTMDFAKKNENQSIQLTYPMDSLVIGDTIAVYINNDNVQVTSLIIGRMLIQSWG